MSIRRNVGVLGLLVWSVAGLGGCPGISPDDQTANQKLLPADGSVPLINIQIDAEREDTAGIQRLANELLRRGIPATVYVTADYANQNALLVHDLYALGFEVALHGYYTGEQLASMTYDEQYDLLSRAMTALKGCEPCGTAHTVRGFRPQYFSQNEDTYRVLDELGLTYNCGFKAGELFLEGHADDVLPYAVSGYNFKAVPMTTLTFGENDIYLCDIACALVQEMSGEEWSQALDAALAQMVARDEPLVVLFHGWYTGDTEQYDYWQPFVNFLDAATTRGAFVTSQELVDLSAE